MFAAESWLPSERFGMENGVREKTSGGIEEGGSTDTVVSWCVRAAGVSLMDWKERRCVVSDKKSTKEPS